jgi:hypothetical protein
MDIRDVQQVDLLGKKFNTSHHYHHHDGPEGLDVVTVH